MVMESFKKQITPSDNLDHEARTHVCQFLPVDLTKILTLINFSRWIIENAQKEDGEFLEST